MHASFGSKQTKLPSLFDAPLLAKIEDNYVGPEEGGRIVFFKSTTEYGVLIISPTACLPVCLLPKVSRGKGPSG